MATPDNYLTLTEEQQKYVRDNSTKVSIETIARDLYTSRHEVMKFVMKEKISINVIKKRKTKQ